MNQPQQYPQQQMRQPSYNQLPRQRIGLDARIASIDPRKKRLFSNLMKLGIVLMIVYGVASLFVYHMTADPFEIDYMGYVNSDFLITIIPLIFLGFGYYIIKGKRIRLNTTPQQMTVNPQQNPQQNWQPPQQQQYQQPRQQQQNPFQQPRQQLNIPPNYWAPKQQPRIQQNPQQQYQQPVAPITGTWKCPNCGFLAMLNQCVKCGYRKRF